MEAFEKKSPNEFVYFVEHDTWVIEIDNKYTKVVAAVVVDKQHIIISDVCVDMDVEINQ